MCDKNLKLIFFLLIFTSFVCGQVGFAGAAEKDLPPEELKNEIVKEILKSAPELKKTAPAITEEERKKIEDPELSQFIKDFCPNRNYISLKVKWDQGTKLYNRRMEIVKNRGPEAAQWKSLNLGNNSFVPLSSAAFETRQNQNISVPSLSNLKTFLDQRLREIYPQCDFEMTRKPQMVSDKIINERKMYLKELSRANPEQVLDSEMIELKVFDPIRTDRKSLVYLIVTAHGYKIRFQAPGKNIIRKPIRISFLVKSVKTDFFLSDIQELHPDPKVNLPSSEIQRAKMDAYSM